MSRLYTLEEPHDYEPHDYVPYEELPAPVTTIIRFDQPKRSADNDACPMGQPLGVSHGTAFVPAYTTGLNSMNAEELMKAEFPPRNLLLAPWLPEKGLAMLYAPRGIGKTWAGLSIAHAVASGGDFLGWKAPRPRRVIYLDGEMPGSLLRDRFSAVVAASGVDLSPDNFRLVAADLQPDGLPDLSNIAAQRFYECVIADADLIVVDNLSTIARGLRENEADSFVPVQSWLLAQRAAGRSVLVIHHSGKGGDQRGTSKKEDVLDTVISLRRPPGYVASEGARFEVRFTKSRGFFGQDAEPFEARFSNGAWSTCEIKADDSDEGIAAMRAEGLTLREMELRTGLSKSALHRRTNSTAS